MKKTTRLVALLIALCLVLSLGFAACKPQEDHTHVDANSDGKCDVCGEIMEHRHVDLNADEKCDICGEKMPKPVSAVKVSVSADKETLGVEDTANVTVSVENTNDKTVTWSYSKENVVKVENGILSVVKKDLRLDTFVTVTATSNADANASASFSVTVIAPKIEGQVGELTSDMLLALGNPSITVAGTVSDYYIDNNNYTNNSQKYYDFTVKMMEGAWSGSWHERNSDSVIYNQYRKGDTLVKGESGETGYALEECYVNKDNEAVSRVVKNYVSIPTLWSTQHLWNHLGSLNINNFVYDAELEMYSYEYNHQDIDELYLMTYLAFSLTPMLGNEDTFDKLYLVIEDGQITKLLAQTFVVTYPEGDENPDATSFTEVEIRFSDIGETAVDNLVTYEAGENTEILQNALQQMSQARRYIFNAVETSIYSPSSDSGDYELSVGTNVSKYKALPNGTSSVGTVGLQGWVTENEILFKKTGKYSYAMDDKLYHFEYYGYKQTSENEYDFFEYSNTDKTYVGKTKYQGNVSDRLPGFQFSANLFKFVEQSTVKGVTYYTYELQEYSVCRDLAMQMSLHYATDCTQLSDPRAKFTIVATQDQIVSVKYPYELTAGYTGYVTVKFTEVGTAEMIKDAVVDDKGIVISTSDVFEGYVERTIPTSWAKTITKYYEPTPGAGNSVTVSSDVAFSDAFGEKFSAATFPQYRNFFNVFGDRIYGPFYECDKIGEDADGNGVYKKYICLTMSTEQYDENHQITVEFFNDLCDNLLNEFAQFGFEYDPANSDMTGGSTGYGTRYYCLISEEAGLQIKLESNGTGNFWLYIYNLGDYQKRS